MPTDSPTPSADSEPTVSYRDLVNEQFNRVWDKFAATEKAINKADAELTQYKLTANEFRGTLSDQALRLATKEEINQRDTLLEIQRHRIDKLEAAAANLQGRIWMLAFIFAGIQVLVNVAQRFFPAP